VVSDDVGLVPHGPQMVGQAGMGRPVGPPVTTGSPSWETSARREHLSATLHTPGV
jgi:hypothetical protein